MHGFKKPKRYAGGGMVRGPGTGVSDSVPAVVPEGTYIMPADSTQTIGAQNLATMGARGFAPAKNDVPVRLSNGEYKLPPEQVHAVGVQALDRMKDATHTPAHEQALFFRDGGAVRARGFAPREDEGGSGGGLSKDAVRAAIQRQSAQREKPPATLRQAAGQAARAAFPIFGKRRDDIDRAAGYADGGLVDEEERRRRTAFPTNVPEQSIYGRTPAAPVVPSGFMPGTRAVYNESGKAISDLAGQGRYGAAAGETVRAALSYVPAVADDVIGGAIRTVGPGIMDAGRQFFGFGGDGEKAAPQAKPPVVPPPAKPEPAAAPAAPPVAPTVAPSPAATPTQPQARAIAPGVYQHGRGQYSDSPDGMGFAKGFTGRPNAQNMAAADALAARYAATSPAQEAPASQNITPQTSGSGFGLLDQGYRDRRAAMMDAQMLKPGARAALAGLLQRQNADAQRGFDQQEAVADRRFRGAQADADRALRREETAARGFETAAERELRAAAQADTAATNAATREARGFETRAAQRREGILQRYDAAKTDAERAQLVSQYPDVFERDKGSAKDNFIVAGGGQEWDAASGTMRNVPQRVIDVRTGQEIGTQGSASQRLPMPKVGEVRDGMRYKGGNVYDEKNWEKV